MAPQVPSPHPPGGSMLTQPSAAIGMLPSGQRAGSGSQRPTSASKSSGWQSTRPTATHPSRKAKSSPGAQSFGLGSHQPVPDARKGAAHPTGPTWIQTPEPVDMYGGGQPPLTSGVLTSASAVQASAVQASTGCASSPDAVVQAVMQRLAIARQANVRFMPPGYRQLRYPVNTTRRQSLGRRRVVAPRHLAIAASPWMSPRRVLQPVDRSPPE